MAAKFICDGCGLEMPATYGPDGRAYKPDAWYQRSDQEGPQHACSRDCIAKVAATTGKTGLVAPFLVLLAFAVGLASCTGEAQREESTPNPAFKVALLFEYDGCRVYRFFDARYVYYSDCRGTTSWIEKVGKVDQTHEVSSGGRRR